MTHEENIELLKQIDSGLHQILELSYPICKNDNLITADICCNINNTANELLKKVTVVLSNIKES